MSTTSDLTQTLKHYESVVVFIPSLGDEAVKLELGKMIADIEGKFAGKVTHNEVWGKKTLGYPIKKAKEGIYAFVQYETMQGKVVDGLEHKLRINETVLRFLTVNRETELKRMKKGEKEIARKLKKHPALAASSVASPAATPVTTAATAASSTPIASEAPTVAISASTSTAG